MTLKKIEYDALTGETIERAYTQEELAMHNAILAEQEAEATATAQEAAAKASAQSKLSALGLTAEEIAALSK